MAMQGITHHGFRYLAKIKDRGKLEAEVNILPDWLVLLLVVALTLFFVISFSLL